MLIDTITVAAAHADTPYEGTLGDIDIRVPNRETYRDRDLITAAHELCHGLNARIRNENNAQYGFYLYDGRGATLTRTSGLTLRDVANAVPREDRDGLWQLYLVSQQEYWNDSPLYVVDELNCYTSGYIVGAEVDELARRDESQAKAREMLRYCHVAAGLLDAASYADVDKLYCVLNHFDRLLGLYF